MCVCVHVCISFLGGGGGWGPVWLNPPHHNPHPQPTDENTPKIKHNTSRLLASGGGTLDRTIKFWNTGTGSLLNSVDTGSQVRTQAPMLLCMCVCVCVCVCVLIIMYMCVDLR